MNEPVKMYMGRGRIIAYALGTLKLEVVSHSTLRSLLPPGRQVERSAQYQERRRNQGYTGTAARSTKNTVSEKVRISLKKFEGWGWIAREGEYIKVYNPKALLIHALRPDLNPGSGIILQEPLILSKDIVPSELLELGTALNDIKLRLLETHRADLVQQALRERVAIERLMRASVDPRDRVRKLM